jgi:anti-sigma regulatory factor (Ser/Thr protein kinase)
MEKATFPAHLDHLHSILSWIGQYFAEVDARSLMHIELATEEVICNIISYSSASSLTIHLGFSTKEARLEFLDDGFPFNPIDKATPDLNASLEDRTIGGLGIHLVRSCMDEIKYARKNNQNILTLVKKL